MERQLLHGNLDVVVYRIDKLHRRFGFNLCSGGTQSIATRIRNQVKNLSVSCGQIVGRKLYATVDLEKARVGRTTRKRNPNWSENFHIYSAHSVSHIIFTLKADDVVSATLIGRAKVHVAKVITGKPYDDWVDILDESNTPIQGNPKLHVRIQFFHVNRNPNWSQGIKTPNFEGVPFTYFNQRENCRITLYQDSHVLDSFKPPISLSGGQLYEPSRCWEDIFDAIWNAKHLIYIVGWSVYTMISLVRDPNRQMPDGNMQLGELLKMKAEQGVKVLMLVWDDRTSVEAFKKDGLMSTHDQETADYFKNSKVRCVLSQRNPDNGKSIIQGLEIATMFTHHQKTLVVDCEEVVLGSDQQTKRKIVSFVGGIDLCDGRYDTQRHDLFATLSTSHNRDFHQPNFEGASLKKGGPREPWHDIHCKLEGPIAWDVLYNFEQRWEKQVGSRHLISQSLLDEFNLYPSAVSTPGNSERWSVQLFRSIDGGAVEGFPQDVQEAAMVGLVSGKDNIIDRSIQDAYIHAIRRAKNFIYIENQYFLGSSFGWKEDDIAVENINALHLIPKELSLKIISKIEAGERFAVYILIPLWPEGKPQSESVQAILDWQRRTIEMMYTEIASALVKKKLKANPREYLSFFCLGNRETKKPGEYEATEKPDLNSNYGRAQQNRRFMIYVHSKMMIVDDEYIIVGSANINQRSMDGGRDSEIGIGAFQPNHIATTTQRPRGQIFGFRMSLWYEHLGFLHDSFESPESKGCIDLLREKGDALWELYSNDLEVDLPGHLLTYPISVADDGRVTNIPGHECFPDTKARVLGNKATFLPPILTT